MIYRYPQQGMIAGVCVGLAKASGLETWVARLIAVLRFAGHSAGREKRR